MELINAIVHPHRAGLDAVMPYFATLKSVDVVIVQLKVVLIAS